MVARGGAVGSGGGGIYHAPDGRAYRLVETLGVNRQVWENVADRTRVEHAFPEQRLALVSMKTY